MYRFPKPETVSVYEEYYATTFIDVVGIVGGTLGLFIGFAFYDTVLLLFDYFLMLLEKIKAFRSWMKSRNLKKPSPTNKKPPKDLGFVSVPKNLIKKPKIVQNKIQDVTKTPIPNSKDPPTSNGPPKKPKPGQNKVEDVPKPKKVDTQEPNAIQPKNLSKKPKVVMNESLDVMKTPSPNPNDPPTSNGPTNNGPTKKPEPGQTKIEDVSKPKEADTKEPKAIQNVPT